MRKIKDVHWYRWFLRNRAKFDFLMSITELSSGKGYIIMSTDDQLLVKEWASFDVAERYFLRAQKRVGFKLVINRAAKQEQLGDWTTWNQEVWGA